MAGAGRRSDADGRLRFHARVAVNVLAIVERELVLGPAQAVAHAERSHRWVWPTTPSWRGGSGRASWTTGWTR